MSALSPLLRFPLALVRAVVSIFALALTYAPLSSNRVGLANIRLRLGRKGFAGHKLFAQVYFQYICYVFEIILLWPLGLLKTDGANALGDLIISIRDKYGLQPHQGIACLGVHYGNIEVLGDAMKKEFARANQKPFYVLAKPLRFPFAQGIMERFREKKQFLVLWTGGAAFQNAFESVVKSGHGLALLTDQKPRKDGLFLPFFGELAAFPDKGIALGLAQRMAFVHVTHRRKKFGHFEMICEEGYNCHLNEQTLSSTPADVLKHYIVWAEKVILEEPGQWSWDYRKWSRKDKAVN